MDDERQVWNALPSVPAVKNNRVYLLRGDEFVVPGPAHRDRRRALRTNASSRGIRKVINRRVLRFVVFVFFVSSWL